MLSKMLLIWSVIPMTLGCAGSADDVCTLATQHLEACTGTVLPLPDTCDSAKANLILGTSCAALTAEGSRSTSSLWDWLFGGGGGGEGDKDKGEVPGDEGQ